MFLAEMNSAGEKQMKLSSPQLDKELKIKKMCCDQKQILHVLDIFPITISVNSCSDTRKKVNTCRTTFTYREFLKRNSIYSEFVQSFPWRKMRGCCLSCQSHIVHPISRCLSPSPSCCKSNRGISGLEDSSLIFFRNH